MMTQYTPDDHAFVVCAYKENPFLPEVVESLLTQTCKSSIYMSTSTPNDYITNLSKKHNLSLLINTGKGNMADNWSFAYENVPDKKLITLVHQDDIFEPNYVETILTYLNKAKKPLIIFTDYYEIRNGKKTTTNRLLRIKRIMNFPWRFNSFQKSRLTRRIILAFGDPICCPSVTYVRDNLPSPLFDTSFSAAVDYKAWVDISSLTGEFVYCKKQLVGHRIYASSGTSGVITTGVKAYEDFLVLSSLWPKWIAKILSHFYQKAEKSNLLDN